MVLPRKPLILTLSKNTFCLLLGLTELRAVNKLSVKKSYFTHPSILFFPFSSSLSWLNQLIYYSSPGNKDKNHLNKSDSHQLFSRHYKTVLSLNYSGRHKLHSHGFPEMQGIWISVVHALLFLQKQEDGRKRFHGSHCAASWLN